MVVDLPAPGSHQSKHNNEERRSPAEAELQLRRLGNDSEGGEQRCCYQNEHPVERAPASGGGLISAAFHSGMQELVFHTVTLSLAAGSLLPGRMLIFRRR